MPEIQNYPGFLIALVMFQIIPGAGTITILNATARSGVRMAVSAVCGMLSGDFIMMVSAMAGLATIMKAYPMLFTGLQCHT